MSRASQQLLSLPPAAAASPQAPVVLARKCRGGGFLSGHVVHQSCRALPISQVVTTETHPADVKSKGFGSPSSSIKGSSQAGQPTRQRRGGHASASTDDNPEPQRRRRRRRSTIKPDSEASDTAVSTPAAAAPATLDQTIELTTATSAAGQPAPQTALLVLSSALASYKGAASYTAAMVGLEYKCMICNLDQHMACSVT